MSFDRIRTLVRLTVLMSDISDYQEGQPEGKRDHEDINIKREKYYLTIAID